MPGIVLLAVLGAVAYRLTTAAQRKQCLEYASDVARELLVAATRRLPEADAFRDRLRARTPYLVITPAFVAPSLLSTIRPPFSEGGPASDR